MASSGCPLLEELGLPCSSFLMPTALRYTVSQCKLLRVPDARPNQTHTTRHSPDRVEVTRELGRYHDEDGDLLRSGAEAQQPSSGVAAHAELLSTSLALQ